MVATQIFDELNILMGLNSNQDHCRSFSPSQTSESTRAGFESALNASSGFVERSSVVYIFFRIKYMFSLMFVLTSQTEYFLFQTLDYLITFPNFSPLFTSLFFVVASFVVFVFHKSQLLLMPESWKEFSIISPSSD